MRRVDWQAVTDVLATVPALTAAWAFGSAKDGRMRDGADLDIGLLFTRKPSLDCLAGLRADLQRALNIDEIDLVVLNEASPLLRFEAISGRALFCADVHRRAEFASLTAREYEDEMGMVAKALEAATLPLSADTL